MNCDQVFDILTRGPFPSGASTDHAVERHLGCCHECRQLAEALRPAVELFHESIDAVESADLPGYRGTLAPPATSPTTTATLVRPAAIGALLRPSWRASSPARATALRLAAAGVLLGAVCVLLFGLGRGGAADKDSSLAVAAAQPRESFHAELQTLMTAFDVPEHCLHPDSETFEAAHGRVQCCTRCHADAHPNAPQLDESHLAELTRSCQVCHES